MVSRHALFSFRRCLRTFDGPESIVYKQSMFRRPPTVALRTVHRLRCSCSFIGTVALPLRKRDNLYPYVYTVLQVKGPSVSSSPSKFRWDSCFLSHPSSVFPLSIQSVACDELIHPSRTVGYEIQRRFFGVYINIWCHKWCCWRCGLGISG